MGDSLYDDSVYQTDLTGTSIFESIDTAFDLLDNDCSFLPQCIKYEIKIYLEPLYISVDLDAYTQPINVGRGMRAKFAIYEHNQEWIEFAKIYTNNFSEEEEGECLKGFENIWKSIYSDGLVQQQFYQELCFSGFCFVSALAPDFDSKEKYDKFWNESFQIWNNNQKQKINAKKRKLMNISEPPNKRAKKNALDSL